MKHLIISAITAAACLTAAAQNERVHVFRSDKNFSTFKGSQVESITYSEGTDGFTKMNVTGTDGSVSTITLSAIDSVTVRQTGLPEIYVNLIDYPDLTDLIKNPPTYTKETIYQAKLRIEGNGMMDDLDELQVEFRGRGNSTWNMAKTPYRFKMAKKKSLAGMPKAKTFALIANYIDCSLMRNAVALWTARYLEMPYANHCVPVVVYLNGHYKGQYMMTEKIGIGGGSVDIDEYKGMLFEIDSNYDEDFRFVFNLSNYTTSQPSGSPFSGKSYLPVMVKDPDLTEIVDSLGTTTTAYFNMWKEDFAEMLKAVMSTPATGSLHEYIDLESAANFYIVNSLACNHEMQHPKSFYIHKTTIDDVYHWGPVWDFDWAFTFDGAEGASATVPLVNSNGDCGGYTFLSALFKNVEFRKIYKEKWDKFVSEGYPKLLQYMEEYANTIEPSAKENGLLWPADYSVSWRRSESSFNFRDNYKALKKWLEERVAYCNSDPNFGIY